MKPGQVTYTGVRIGLQDDGLYKAWITVERAGGEKTVHESERRGSVGEALAEALERSGALVERR